MSMGEVRERGIDFCLKVEADGPLAAVVAGGLPVALQQRQRNPASCCARTSRQRTVRHGIDKEAGQAGCALKTFYLGIGAVRRNAILATRIACVGYFQVPAKPCTVENTM
ncbi:MAG: hypothetical protein ACTHOP_01970 [Mesorhizobium sp.]